MDKYQFSEKVGQTRHLVEADSFAKLCLWERWSSESRSQMGDGFPQLAWKDHPAGTTLEIGQLDGRPVMLTLFWSTIESTLVCFWNSGSQVTDHAMVEDFLEKTFPGVPRRDAMNFGNVVGDIRDAVRAAQASGRPRKDPEFPEARRILGREAVELFRREGIVTTRAIETAQVARDRGEDGAEEVWTAVESMTVECEEFRKLVWLPWLKAYYQHATTTGHEANGGPISMMVGGMAGRVMVTLRYRHPVEGDENDFVSLLGYDGEDGGLHVRGAYGNAAKLTNMIDVAIQYGDALREDMRPSGEVGLAV